MEELFAYLDDVVLADKDVHKEEGVHRRRRMIEDEGYGEHCPFPVVSGYTNELGPS